MRNNLKSMSPSAGLSLDVSLASKRLKEALGEVHDALVEADTIEDKGEEVQMVSQLMLSILAISNACEKLIADNAAIIDEALGE